MMANAHRELQALLDENEKLVADRDWWQRTANKWKTQYEAHNPFSEVDHVRKFRNQLMKEVDYADLTIAELEAKQGETK